MYTQVTGVVLSNASLDIAFHDVYSFIGLDFSNNIDINFYCLEKYVIVGHILNFKDNISNKQNYIEQFWVGLLEGDGSIIVRKNKQNKVYGGFEISLKYLPENEEMLNTISIFIGGRIYYEKKENQIIKVKWVAVASKDVQNCLKIIKKYPLITSRKKCQLDHLINCMEKKEWDYHLKTRDHKYDLQLNIINDYNNSFIIPNYFKTWLSGFIEAEGCFRFRNNKATSFYICQNNDLYILNAIKTTFNSNHKIGIHKDLRYSTIHYRISISGKPCLNLINEHLTNYPLIGNKLSLFDIWSKSFK